MVNKMLSEAGLVCSSSGQYGVDDGRLLGLKLKQYPVPSNPQPVVIPVALQLPEVQS